MNTVSIVTVNFHETAVTLAFLIALLKNKGSQNIEIILVDNGCTRSNEEIFKRTCPELIYIQSEKNLGFAGGNNLGIRRATGQYVLFLNNDTEITPGFLSTMVEEMQHNPNIGLLSPLILYYSQPDVIQYAGYTAMNYFTARNKTIGKFALDQGQFDRSSHETGYCHGAAMMCKREDLSPIGLMDENYFLYYEEIDWCEKFKNAGKQIWFTGKAKIYHKESISVGMESPLKTYFLSRNRVLFIRKNTSTLNQFIFGLYFYGLVAPISMLTYCFKGQPALAKSVWNGLFWNLKQPIHSEHLGFPGLKQ